MNKELRRKRTESYFVDALCDIIRSQGMDAATIRNVAEKAGYNSATLYTYFNNFSHLLLRAHFKFELELLEKMQTQLQMDCNENICDMWASAYRFMADYYLENPNIFECIFIAKYEGGIPNELRATHEQQSEFMQFVYRFLERVSQTTGMQIQAVRQLHQTCLSLTVGTILLHLRERDSHPKEEILHGLTVQIQYFLESQVTSK